MISRLSLAAFCLCYASFAFAQVPVYVDFKPQPVLLSPKATVGMNPSASKGTVTPPNSFQETNPQNQHLQGDRDIQRLKSQQLQQQAFMDEVDAAFAEVHIDYRFPTNDDPDKKYYHDALSYFRRTLEGIEPLNLEAAVFIVEHAFDPALNYTDFNQQLTKATNVIGLKMQQDRISATDNVGKIMTTFKYVSDTISVSSLKQEATITSYPKAYDFEDFWGVQDHRKMFVSKLMQKGNGQCHSLPLYFLILCERMNANAHLAFAPNHSFIKFQDKRGGWHNIELTNGMLASDHFMVESGYVKAEAIQNRIYLEPLTKKETIVQCLNDLALGYLKKFGYDQFVLECADLAMQHDSNSLSAHQIKANYFMMLDKYVQYQYRAKGLKRDSYKKDKEASAIVSEAISQNTIIEQLGYSEMPPEIYVAWLKSAQKESMKQQHQKEVKVLGGMIEKK